MHLWRSPHPAKGGTAALFHLRLVRFRLLNHDHVEGTWDTACDSASPRPSVPAKQREALLALKLFAAVVDDDPIERPDLLHVHEPKQQRAVRIRRTPGSLAGASRSPGRRLKKAIRPFLTRPPSPGGTPASSSSVSSDSQDSLELDLRFLSSRAASRCHVQGSSGHCSSSHHCHRCGILA